MNKEDLINLLQREDTIISDLELSQITNLIEVRNQMRKLVVEEGSCNCILCNRKITKYRRAMNKGQYFFLLHLTSKWHKGEFIHYDTIKSEIKGKYQSSATDYAMLANFGLLEMDEEKDETTGVKRGRCRVTQLGWDFIRGKATIPEAIFTVNGKVVGKTEKTIDFTQAQKKFKMKDIYSK